MIPKIIHYVWLGDEEPDLVKKAMNSWEKALPEYKIVRWGDNEVKKYFRNDFVINAYNKKKFAFVSDYVRLCVLYEYGGIYLDTDMIVKKNFDDFLHYKTFWGRMYSNAIGAGVIGSEKDNNIIKLMINAYDNNRVNMTESNNRFITRFFINQFSTFSTNNIKQILDDDNLLLPTYYFYLPCLFQKRNSYSEHLFVNSWIQNSKRNVDIISQLPSWFVSIVRNYRGKKRFYKDIDYSSNR